MNYSTNILDNLEKLLFDLVSINSANPDYSPAAPGEKEIGSFIHDFFVSHKIDCAKQMAADGRYNIIAKVEGKKSAPTIVLCSHLDTVYLDGMDFKPFKDSKYIYGPGSCDTKASIAAMMSAILNYSKQKPVTGLNVYFAGVISEESMHIGIRRLLEEFDKYISKADFFIIGEPTNLNIGIAHKGSLKFTIRTKGKNAHGSTPHLGRNAISMMGKLINAIESEIVPEYLNIKDELLGNPTVNIGTIKGGRAFNIVPDNCSIEIDRRLVPAETVEKVLKRFSDLIEGLKKNHPGNHKDKKGATDLSFDAEIAGVNDYIPFLNTDSDNDFAESFEKSCKGIYKKSQITGLSYATDGGFTSEAGIPTVVFGPGNIDNCHMLGEFVSREQLKMATMILSDYLSSFKI